VPTHLRMQAAHAIDILKYSEKSSGFWRPSQQDTKRDAELPGGRIHRRYCSMRAGAKRSKPAATAVWGSEEIAYSGHRECPFEALARIFHEASDAFQYCERRMLGLAVHVRTFANVPLGIFCNNHLHST
jgi:hypothetical protein